VDVEILAIQLRLACYPWDCEFRALIPSLAPARSVGTANSWATSIPQGGVSVIVIVIDSFPRHFMSCHERVISSSAVAGKCHTHTHTQATSTAAHFLAFAVFRALYHGEFPT
jgi:hypothetical protein